MMRTSASRLAVLLRRQPAATEDAGLQGLMERWFSGHLAGPSPSSQRQLGTGTWQQLYQRLRGRHAPEGGQLPWRFGGVTSRKPLGSSLMRAFSTGPAPKRGFENFIPKNQSKQAGKPSGGQGAPKKTPPEPSPSGGKPEKPDPNDPNVTAFVISVDKIFLALGGLFLLYQARGLIANNGAQEISFQEFKRSLLPKGVVTRLEVTNGNLVKVYTKASDDSLEVASGVGAPNGTLRYVFQIGSVDSFERKLEEAQREMGVASRDFIPVKYTSEVSVMDTVVSVLPTLLLIGGTYWLISRTMRQLGGGLGGGLGGKGGKGGGMGGFGGRAGGIFGMGRANTTGVDKAAKEKVMFKDVAGCDEAKLEIMEFVDFLKNPNKYKELGAKIPKGALLVGPPGTGKTLLAKATAGEASVPFLSISGSDFMEMFVGVGPARVRDLFAQARSQAPSIIFIDEIDAIGRARGRGGAMGGNDERENTLNQLLVEMDGFASTTGVIVLAGTNRPDILDKALLRPGRFDRTISVDAPDVNGREQIFRVHLGKLRLAHPVEHYSDRLAALTPGMSGADIANVCNEAALMAARLGKERVEMADFEQALDRVIGGLEKKNKVITKEERRTVALHESGHAVVSWFLEHAEPLLKVSIVPRGASVLGFAQYLPNENVLLTKEQLMDRICAILGGRAAEDVLIGRITTGAQNDLERVTQMAYAQVAVYGMNERLGLLSFPPNKDAFDKPYSDHTAQMIDEEVRKFVDVAYQRTCAIVREKKHYIEGMAAELLSKEVINVEDVERLLGKRLWGNSGEMRNIDRLRRQQLPLAAGDATTTAGGEAETPAPASSNGEGGDKPGGGDGSGPKPPPPGSSGSSKDGKGFKRRVEPGMAVAT